MSRDYKRDLDHLLQRFERRLPLWAAKFVRWVRQPGSSWMRILLGVALIAGGIVGFLPILGFWMIPLGLLVMAKDVPFLRPSVVRLFEWGERKWPDKAKPAKR